MIIGNGLSSAISDAFRVLFNGNTYSASGVLTTGADYAEMFEWRDQNPKRENRRGYFVTLDGEHIRKATAADDYILGVISGSPSVVGDTYGCGWQGMYVRDEWGDVVYEWADQQQQETHTFDPATKQLRTHTETVPHL